MHQRIRFWTGAALSALFAAAALFGPALAAHDPHETHLERAFERPSAGHWFGLDELGRDLFSRALVGARQAFFVSVVGVGFGAAAGTLLGLWSGYCGGIFDRVTARAIDALLAFPGFLLALVVASAASPGTTSLVIAVGFFSFPAFARVARATARSLREEAYVAASIVLGAARGYILRRHVLANAWPPLAALSAVRMGQAIATASGLSFLGLGPPLPFPDWGTMIDTGREYLWVEPRLVLVPGVCVALSSLGFYLLGDALSAGKSADV